jgi:hypothetical protein
MNGFSIYATFMALALIGIVIANIAVFGEMLSGKNPSSTTTKAMFIVNVVIASYLTLNAIGFDIVLMRAVNAV